jgi:hypothetical protein
MDQAGLAPIERGAAQCPFEYPDAETAWRALSSAGPLIRAMCYAGEERVKAVVLESLAPYQTPLGGYRQENTFRFVIATA